MGAGGSLFAESGENQPAIVRDFMPPLTTIASTCEILYGFSPLLRFID